jgi:proline iminopeptidase
MNKDNLYISPKFENAVLKNIKTDGNVTELWEFKGTKDYILLISGGPGVPNYLYPVAKYLNDNGYKVVMYNQRGTGNSINTDNDYELDSFVKDIEKIREELNIETFHIFGHSWGGLLSQLYSSKYPLNVKSLFLSNSAIGTGNDWKIMEKRVMKYNQQQSTTANWLKLGGLSGTAYIPGNIGDLSTRSLMNLVWKNYFENPAEVEDADKEWLNGVFSTAMHKTRNSIVNTESTYHSNEYNIPVTILYGEKDICEHVYDTIFSRFNNSKHIVLSNSGRLPWIQNKNEYFDILSDFYGNKSDTGANND